MTPKTFAAIAATLVACAPATPSQAARLNHRFAGYEVQLLVDGVPMKTWHHRGETFVLGSLGARYEVRVVNHTGRRIEAVVSVDGRDVIDGKPGDFRSKRGYLVPEWGHVDIEGWRLSTHEVAAFRFSSVDDSYAARTGSGREVGVIGVAVFPEREPPRPLPIAPQPDCEYDDSDYDARRDAAGWGERASRGPAAGAPAAQEAPEAKSESAPRAERRSAAPSYRPGLGTEFGERRDSQVQTVEFVREIPSHPSALLGVRYDDRRGLLAQGVPLDEPRLSEAELRRTADPFPETDRGFATPPRGWYR